MAEAFLKQIAGTSLDVHSAGLEAGTLNPLVVEAMDEVGIDISANRTKTVRDPSITHARFDYVITVCQEASAQACPIFPSQGERQFWYFDDPSEFKGSDGEKLRSIRIVRDAIKKRVSDWYESLGARLPQP